MLRNIEIKEPGSRCIASRAPGVGLGQNDDAPNLTKPHITGKAYVEFEGPIGPACIRLTGWGLWSLRMLIDAGATGLKPAEHPGVPWGELVFNLRDRGLDIIPIRQTCGDHYPACQRRYVLRTPIEFRRVEDLS